MMNRREILRAAGGLAAAGGIAACDKLPKSASTAASPAAGPGTADPLKGDALQRDVDAYVKFGTHRSGSPGDISTSDWFARRWKALGYEIEQPTFDLPNSDTTRASIEIAGETFDGFAQPPLAFTPPDGVSAPLVMWNPKSPGDVTKRIAVVHVPRQPGAPSPSAAYRDAFGKARDAGAVGVLAIVSGPAGEPVAINTPVELTVEIPVLMVGEKDRARIEAAMAKGGPAKLRIEGPGGFRSARNTIARAGTSGPWLIISTPQSGWFTCGGERGPGVAMSLALSEWALQRKLPCRLCFVATSGHEWVDYGAHQFHQNSAPKPEETILWFHLGASYGARAYEETAGGLKPLDAPNAIRTFMVSSDMAPIVAEAFAGQPDLMRPAPADLATSLGELTYVIKEGYKSLAGFYGAHSRFHTANDGADATSPAIMEPIARAIARSIEMKVMKPA